jgi:hypothetical protein
MTRDSTAIADRITMGTGPLARCRRVRRTAAAPSLRRRLAGGLGGCAGSTGSTTSSQPPTRSGQFIEVGLAQVEFIAGGAVVYANRRDGLGPVTVKIAGKHDTCCLGHDSSLQRHTSDEPLARIPNTTIDLNPRRGSTNEPRFVSTAGRHPRGRRRGRCAVSGRLRAARRSRTGRRSWRCRSLRTSPARRVGGSLRASDQAPPS